MKLATLLLAGAAVASFNGRSALAQSTEPLPQPPPAASEAKVPVEHAWLGVATWPVSPALAEKFKLSPGFHLAIIEAAPESPAARAGLRTDDILLRLDDQILVNSSQLRTLIRSHKPGESVKVAFLRDGKEQTLSIPLGSKVFHANEGSPGASPTSMDLMELLARSSGLPDLQAHVRILDPDEPKGELAEISSTATVVRSDDSGTIHVSRNDSGTNLRCVDAKGTVVFQGPVNTPEERAKVPADWLAKADQLGANANKAVPQAPNRRRVIIPSQNTAAVSMQNSDDAGTITLTVNQGSKNVRCEDPMGNILFEGPVNTPAERSQVPPEWLRRVDALNTPIPVSAGNEPPRRRVILPEQPAPPRQVIATTPPPRRQVVQPDAAPVSIVIDTSPDGTLALREENGHRTLRATDSAGAVLFDGPVDSAEERAKLPAGLSERLEKLSTRLSPKPSLPTPIEEGK
jgi:membrane-associated protease RseP (regulator of RpoE activity)